MLRLDRTECRLQDRQLLVSLQPAKPFGCFLHSGPGPAQRHRDIPPMLHIAAHAADRAHHVLDDIVELEFEASVIGEQAERLGRLFPGQSTAEYPIRQRTSPPNLSQLPDPCDKTPLVSASITR